ncbi:MAG TPA: methylmalonyl-CoA mutase family protein [Caulobacteraceae bacterium]|nr:methylmalonyl-CoA mutase family protein [Caulobacteraceae bacterium]
MDAVSDPVALADLFPHATRAEWLALVEKTLKGAGVETLETRTADGLMVKPLYAADDAPPAAPMAREAAGWDIRVVVAAGEDANAHALDALAGGATSLLVDARDGGKALARTLDGVVTEVALVALDSGSAGLEAAYALNSVAKASPGARLAFHIDPLSAFAEFGGAAPAVEDQIAATAGFAAQLAETYPKASLFLATGRVIHEAGGAPACEIAFAAAAALTYAKALTIAGLDMSQAWGRIVLGLSVEAEPIVGVAKLRAARVVWDRITSACGAGVPAHVEARSSRRMLARTDHWTNLVRLTAAGFAAAVGGADAVVLGAFDEPLGREPEFLARRQARNIQLILKEEAKLGEASDPAAGCWALEAQTDALARAAWERLTAIERQGGLIAALTSGSIAREVGEARANLQAALADKSRRIVGVTDFRPSDPPPDEAKGPQKRSFDAPPPHPISRCPPLAPIRLEDLVA